MLWQHLMSELVADIPIPEAVVISANRFVLIFAEILSIQHLMMLQTMNYQDLELVGTLLMQENRKLRNRFLLKKKIWQVGGVLLTAETMPEVLTMRSFVAQWLMLFLFP